jgi:hypothetical protein
VITELLPNNVLIQSVILLLRVCFEVSVAQKFLHGVNMAQYVHNMYVYCMYVYIFYNEQSQELSAFQVISPNV